MYLNSINPYSEFVIPRLNDLSPQTNEIYKYLYSAVFSSDDIRSKLFPEEPLIRVTKRLTELKNAGLVYRLKKGTLSIGCLVNFLHQQGPSSYEEIIKGLKLPPYVLNKGRVFFQNLEAVGILAKSRGAENKLYFYLPWVEEQKIKVKIKRIKYAERILFEILDGEKTTKEIADELGISRKYALKILYRIKDDVSMLEEVKLNKILTYWIRKGSPRKASLLQMADESISKKIKKLLSKDQLTVREISSELNLSRHIVGRIVKILKRQGFVDGVRAKENSRSSQIPPVYYTLTNDPEVNKINKIKAMFKSASPTYGYKVADVLIDNPIPTYGDIKSGVKVSDKTLENLLQRLKKRGLLKNIYTICWFNSSLAPEASLVLEKLEKDFYKRTGLELSRETFESIVKCLKHMPSPNPDEKLNMFIAHAYPILTCLKEKKNSREELYNCLKLKMHKNLGRMSREVNTLTVLYLLEFYKETGKITSDPVRKSYSLKNEI